MAPSRSSRFNSSPGAVSNFKTLLRSKGCELNELIQTKPGDKIELFWLSKNFMDPYGSSCFVATTPLLPPSFLIKSYQCQGSSDRYAEFDHSKSFASFRPFLQNSQDESFPAALPPNPLLRISGGCGISDATLLNPKDSLAWPKQVQVSLMNSLKDLRQVFFMLLCCVSDLTRQLLVVHPSPFLIFTLETTPQVHASG